MIDTQEDLLENLQEFYEQSDDNKRVLDFLTRITAPDGSYGTKSVSVGVVCAGTHLDEETVHETMLNLSAMIGESWVPGAGGAKSCMVFTEYSPRMIGLCAAGRRAHLARNEDGRARTA